MSVRASTWAWEQEGLDPAAKLVLLALADQAQRDGSRAFPSRASLAEMTGVSVDTVDRRLALLLELELIRLGDQQHVDHLPPQYRPRVYDLAMPQSQGPQAAAPRGRSDDAQRPQDRQPEAAAVRHNPSTYPRDNPAPTAPMRGGHSHDAPLCHRCYGQHPDSPDCPRTTRAPGNFRDLVRSL